MNRGDERYADFAPDCKLTQELLALADQDMLLRPLPVAKQLGIANLLSQPQLLPDALSGEPLSKWYAARVEAADDEALHIRMAECLNISPEPEDFLLSTINKEAFEACCRDEEFSNSTRGRYLEIGEYGLARSPLVKVFPMEGVP